MTKTNAEDFAVQLGMFVDTYTCKHCGLEWRTVISPHYMHHTHCKAKFNG